MKAYNQFKTWLALKATYATGTMECAFFFAALAIFGFPGAHATLYQYVQWFSTTFLQLVMLPLLSAGQAAHKDDIQSLHEKFDTHIARKKAQTATLPPRGKGGRFMKKEASA